MGLLEKAMQYNSNLNDNGITTLINSIPGPAETALLPDENDDDDDFPTIDESKFEDAGIEKSEIEETEIADLEIADDDYSELENFSIDVQENNDPDILEDNSENDNIDNLLTVDDENDNDSLDPGSFFDDTNDDANDDTFSTISIDEEIPLQSITKNEDIPEDDDVQSSLPDLDDSFADELDNIDGLEIGLDDNKSENTISDEIDSFEQPLSLEEDIHEMEDFIDKNYSLDNDVTETETLDIEEINIANEISDEILIDEPSTDEIISDESIPEEIIPDEVIMEDILPDEITTGEIISTEEEINDTLDDKEDFFIDIEETALEPSTKDNLLEEENEILYEKSVEEVDIHELITNDNEKTPEEIQPVEEPRKEPKIISIEEDHSAPDLDIPVSGNKSIFIDLSREEAEVENEIIPVITHKYSARNKDAEIVLELSKEIIKAETLENLYDMLLFALMGQLGASCAGILSPMENNSAKWVLSEPRGMKLKTERLTFKISDPILNEILEHKELIELDESYRTEKNHEEYLKFISINTNLIIPVAVSGLVKFAVILGEKITVGDYSDNEKEFINNIITVVKIIYDKIFLIDSLKKLNDKLIMNEQKLIDIDTYETSIRSSETPENIQTIIQKEMNSFGVESYAFFIKDDINDKYIIAFNESEDFMNLKQSNYTIELNNPFITHLHHIDDYEVIENPITSMILRKVFKDNILTRINTFSLYPYKIKSELVGFLILFRVNHMEVVKNVLQIKRLSKALFSYLESVKIIDLFENKYSDSLELVYKRVNDSIKSASDLKIQLTVAMFSFKNLKRFYNLYGDKEVRKIFSKFKTIAEEKLSDTDFAVRYDRNKILVVLPGKNKKFATTLCTYIRNDISQQAGDYDIQLMVTFSTAEFPEDGNALSDLLALLD